jgi:sporulation protein YqfC
MLIFSILQFPFSLVQHIKFPTHRQWLSSIFHLDFLLFLVDLQSTNLFCINIMGIKNPVFVDFVHLSFEGRRRTDISHPPAAHLQEENMDKIGKHILERASERLDLPGNILAGMSRMEIIGSGTLLLEQHKGILSYGTEEIHIGVSDGVVKIKGTELMLRAMDAQALLVTGQLSSVEFIR